MTTIDQIIAEKLNSFYVDGWPIGNVILCSIAMLLTVVLVGAIGLERERKGSNAGLRTHILVGVGSCMIMIVSIYGFPYFEGTGDFFKRDVARLAAAVVTGVGFLGAGAIIHRNAGITGLTTAATIWISMAIGLVCGSLNFILAIGATVLILIVLVVFRKMEKKMYIIPSLVTLKAHKDVPVVSYLLEVTQSSECHAHNLQIQSSEDDDVQITFSLVPNNKDFQADVFLSKLEKIDGIKSVTISRR